ncbi:MAG: hypothetical protein LBC85_00480 [Fibromonadaceae bacterium]|jgi:hypothetical protein|nr:hypothetical protein [Fibromonadaceae bacterium]
MKKSVKIFVCSIVVSVVLLSCVNAADDGELGNSSSSIESGSLSSSSELENSSSSIESGNSSSSSEQENLSSSSFEMKVPQMDKRVVAYIYGNSGKNEIITDMDKLKELFKVALNEENFDPVCDYFAIPAFASEGLTYFVVSKDQSTDGDFLILYRIYPSLEQPNSPYESPGIDGLPACMYSGIVQSFSFLICDKDGG